MLVPQLRHVSSPAAVSTGTPSLLRKVRANAASRFPIQYEKQPGGREHLNTFSAQKSACQCRFAISDSMRNTFSAQKSDGSSESCSERPAARKHTRRCPEAL